MVPVRAAVNHLHTLSPVAKLASVSLRSCAQLHFGISLFSWEAAEPSFSRLQLANKELAPLTKDFFCKQQLATAKDSYMQSVSAVSGYGALCVLGVISYKSNL